MRLLRCRDLTFHEFFGRDKPNYAIISHRWSNEELSHQSFNSGRGSLSTGEPSGYGWTKIAKACEITLKNGLEWVWMDTICIDKTSSAELIEAINSMFDWFRMSHACYVFLPDVYHFGEVLDKIDECDEISIQGGCDGFYKEEFERSDWFSRAWTLQELLAPSRVYFYNSRFNYIGSRNTLASFIGHATGIPKDLLTVHPDRRDQRIVHASVAERMKWASKRQATREEDKAYSLLGLFGVNMPLFYGEGRRAFQRLQMEIIKMSDDESIFAWSAAASPHSRSGMLAYSIEQFSQGANIEKDNYVPRQHYEMTHKGLRLGMTVPRFKLTTALQNTGQLVVLLPLNCQKIATTSSESNVRYPIAVRITVRLGPASTVGSLRYMIGIRQEGFFIFGRPTGIQLLKVSTILDETQ